jgi:copper homeostasis protein (lipoprotein)
MKKLLLWLISLIIFFQISCNTRSLKVSENGKTNRTAFNSSENNFSGTFTGTTPCADCPGIKTTVSFNRDSTFIENMEYLARNTSFSDTGKWTISDSMITVSFPAKKKSHERFYRIKSDSTIAMLDGNNKEIEAALSKYYILKKVEE